MRIAHLVIGGDVAGGQLVALRLARAARARGDEALVIVPRPGPFVDLLAADGVAAHLVDVSRLTRVLGALQLTRLLARERVDVLHTHGQVAVNVIGRVAARLAGAAVVSHMHIENHFRRNRLARAVYRSLDNLTARLCSRIVCVSDQTRHALERQGYPRRLMVTIHNGVELPSAPAERAGRIRSELGIGPEVPLVGTIGRLCDVKGQRELIQAVARLDDVHAVLVGDDIEHAGAYREQLEREAQRLGIAGRVAFRGYTPDVGAVLADIDVFALASWVEGLPMVVLEAMAAGKAVVATAVGGTPELVIDGDTGLLVPPRDPAALADALRTLVANPGLRRRLGDAGRSRVAQHFRAEGMESRVLDIYDEIARRRTAPLPASGAAR